MYAVVIILYFTKGKNKLLMCVTITVAISIDGTLVTTFEVFVPLCILIFKFLIVKIIYYFQAYYKLF